MDYTISLDRLGTLDQFQEFIPGPGIAPEAAKHGTGYHVGILLFHTTHHDTEVEGFHNNANTLGGQFLIHNPGHLGREPFLNLEPPGKHIDKAGQF